MFYCTYTLILYTCLKIYICSFCLRVILHVYELYCDPNSQMSKSYMKLETRIRNVCICVTKHVYENSNVRIRDGESRIRNVCICVTKHVYENSNVRIRDGESRLQN